MHMKSIWATLLAMLPVVMTEENIGDARREMVEEIKMLDEATRDETGREPISERVLQAMQTVPRHEFVPPDEVSSAYRNRPLPIGHGQTISQPYIVALMTDLAQAGAEDRKSVV